jgi:hypothetical protein
MSMLSSTDPSRIAQGLKGYTHQVRSRVPSGQRVWPSPSVIATIAQGSGARPCLRLPINGSLDPLLSLLPALGASQGLGIRRHALNHKAQGLPGATPRAWLYQPLPWQGHARSVTQEDKFLCGLQGLRSSRAHTSAARVDLLATKKSLEGAPRGGRSTPTQPDT